MPADEYIKQKFSEGTRFENFVYDVLRAKGCDLTPYRGREEQLKGENPFGLEIKYQSRQEQTGRLWFEREEKSSATDETWRLSGIWRRDNSWLMATGYWHHVYIFAIRDLRKHELCSGVTLQVNNRQTSIGWLMDAVEAHRLCLKHYHTERYYEGHWRLFNVD